VRSTSKRDPKKKIAMPCPAFDPPDTSNRTLRVDEATVLDVGRPTEAAHY
jgi:hypothetical protein